MMEVPAAVPTARAGYCRNGEKSAGDRHRRMALRPGNNGCLRGRVRVRQCANLPEMQVAFGLLPVAQSQTVVARGISVLAPPGHALTTVSKTVPVEHLIALCTTTRAVTA